MLKNRNKMKTLIKVAKRTIFLWILLASTIVYAQQEPMYTQYMFNTQAINPAYAGTWHAIGFMALARHQWTGWDGAPKTYTFGMQAPLKNEKIALGLNVMSDEIGFEKRFSLFGDYSYEMPLSEKSTLNLGLKAGFTNYSHNFNEYSLYPDGVSDPRFQGGIEAKWMPNFGVGAFLYSPRYYVGLSVPKMIENDFDDNEGNYSVEAELRHFYLIGGVVFDVGENVKFKPTGLLKATVGSPLQFDLSANFLLREKIWLGAMYRSGSSTGFIAQWIFNHKLRVGYAIDFSLNSTRPHHHGTHEIMVSYEIRNLVERVVSPRYF